VNSIDAASLNHWLAEAAYQWNGMPTMVFSSQRLLAGVSPRPTPRLAHPRRSAKPCQWTSCMTNSHGRSICLFDVIDDDNRENLGIEVDFSLP